MFNYLPGFETLVDINSGWWKIMLFFFEEHMVLANKRTCLFLDLFMISYINEEY